MLILTKGERLTQMNGRRVPVVPRLSGEIVQWEKNDGDTVWEGKTLCIIKPIVAIYRRDEVPSPASGRLIIKRAFKKPGAYFSGGTTIAEVEEILGRIIV
jgi:pyruvate/2-oxoglutarate dehydrogenase complex dihydrolipoamide acyltransferase (E2) component